MPLPPDVPLSEKDLRDPRLQPIVEAPAMLAGDDAWEVILHEYAFKDCENLADVFEYIMEHWREIDHSGGSIKIRRIKRGDFV